MKNHWHKKEALSKSIWY